LRTLLLLLGLLSLAAVADAGALKLRVIAPYLELHTGPGTGYPIDQVAKRGEWVKLLKRRTDWFMVSTHKGNEGWVHLSQIRQTETEDGMALNLHAYSEEDFRQRNWEMGFHGGGMDGAALLNLYAGYAFTPNLSAELSFSQALGSFSSEYQADLNLLSQPFPEWRYSPFFTLGTGLIHTSPNATLVESEDRTDTTAHAGVGLRVFLGRRFFLRGEFRHYTVFTSRNENEEFNQWKLGLGVYF
jgi:hypothetical protein